MAVSKRFINISEKVAQARGQETVSPKPVKVQPKVKKEYGFEAMSATKAAYRAKNIDEFTELVLSKPVRKKHPGRLRKEEIVHMTGRPCCTGWGMLNPIKLKISDSTLNTLKEGAGKGVNKTRK